MPRPRFSFPFASAHRVSGLRRLIDRHVGPAVLLDRDGRILAVNPRGDLLGDALAAGEPAVLTESVRAALGGAEASGRAVIGQGEHAKTLDFEVLPFDGRAFVLLAWDVTLERNMRAALIDSRQRFKDLVEVSADFAWEVGADGRFVYVTPRGALGYAAADLIGRRPDTLIAAPVEADPFRPRRRIEEEEIRLRAADGAVACLLVTALPLTGADGTWRGARGVCRDVTADREKDAALARVRHRERILDGVDAAIRDEIDPQAMLNVAAAKAMRALDARGVRIYRIGAGQSLEVAAEDGTGAVEPAFEVILGGISGARGVMEISSGGLRLLAVAAPYRQRLNGALCVWRPLTAGDWTDDERLIAGDVAGRLGVALAQYANHQRILRLSRTDPLTGLLNRRAFFEQELPRRLARSWLPRGTGALVLVDLDNFKLVNDVHGHQRGDEVLLLMRDLLEAHSRPADLVARLGGDEFVLWFDRIAPEVVIERVEALLADSVGLRDHSGDVTQPLSLSIGVAVFDPADHEDQDSLVARADAAMYAVKRRGKSGVEISTPPGTATDR